MIDKDAFEELIRKDVPLIGSFDIRVLSIEDGAASLLMPYQERFVRPGGTITGPAMFGLADVALYGAVMSVAGRVELAVTTSMTINFLRRPRPASLRADARLLKFGRRLAYGDVSIFAGDDPEPVAHASGTYSLPPVAPSAMPAFVDPE